MLFRSALGSGCCRGVSARTNRLLTLFSAFVRLATRSTRTRTTIHARPTRRAQVCHPLTAKYLDLLRTNRVRTRDRRTRSLGSRAADPNYTARRSRASPSSTSPHDPAIASLARARSLSGRRAHLSGWTGRNRVEREGNPAIWVVYSERGTRGTATRPSGGRRGAASCPAGPSCGGASRPPCGGPSCRPRACRTWP